MQVVVIKQVAPFPVNFIEMHVENQKVYIAVCDPDSSNYKLAGLDAAAVDKMILELTKLRRDLPCGSTLPPRVY